MTTPSDPYANPPGWTDPYADVSAQQWPDAPQPKTPRQPPGPPSNSPLLTALIIGLLLVALSVAVFQLLGSNGSTPADTTTTSDPSETTTTTPDSGTTTTAPTTSTLPDAAPYPPVEPAIPVEDQKLITDGMRINDNDIPDITFGTDAATAIGRFTASFGEATGDTGWRVSTGGFGVCIDDFERIITFGTYAAIITKPGGQEQYNGYRHDLQFGDATHPTFALETLSGLRISDTVAELKETYQNQKVSFSSDPKLGTIYTVESAASGDLLLWGPVEGESDADRIMGIYAPDVCGS